MIVDASKMFTFGIVIVVLASFPLLSTGYSITIPPDPNAPGKCTYRNEELKLGVNIGPLPCQRLTCEKSGSVLVEGCGKIRLDGCNRGERINFDKTYPECCTQRFKCKRPDGSSYYVEKDIL